MQIMAHKTHPLLLPVGYVLDDDDETDERTSFVRQAKAQRKYGSTSNNGMNDPTSSSSSFKFHQDSYTHHFVQPGDTLQGIALRYQTTMEYLKRVNKLWTSDTLFLREYLLVPLPAGDCGTNLEHGTVATLVVDDRLTSTSAHAPATPVSDGADRSVKDYLGSIDEQIEEAKSKAQKLTKSSVLKGLPEVISHFSRSRVSSRLRQSLSVDTSVDDRTAPSVVLSSGNPRLRTSFYQLERSTNEIFEL